MKTDKTKKVLIALDYDATSKKVAEEGYSLVQSMNAETILLHVISELPVYYSDSNYNHEFKVDMLEDLNKTSQAFLDKAKKHLGDENIQTVVIEGEIADTILKTAKKMDVDIIVMGSHSRKWLETILLGSQAEDILTNSPIPVLIVPVKKKED
ncbi:MAG: universal stress protein [Paludibacter sp.]|nr:universal stress protein [Paludibacter sp.]